MKNKRLLALATLLAVQTQPTLFAKAQDDDFSGGTMGDDFDAPLDSPFSGPSGVSSGRGASKGANKAAPVKENGITKDQKNKFARANNAEITNENFPETIESFDFPSAEITDVVKAISELTGKNFILDPGVRGKVSIIAPSKITVAEAYKAFLSALAINGFSVAPMGNFLKIKTSRNAVRENPETYTGAYFPNTDQMITKVIHLKHISANTIKSLNLLRSKDGDLDIFESTNSLIISDYGTAVDRISRIIETLDVPGFEEQLEVAPIRFAKAKDIADLISKIVNKGDTKNNSMNGGFSAGIPRFSRPTGATTTSGQQGASFFTVFPDDRTNSLIIVGNKSGIERVRKLITQLDFKIRPEDAGGVYVYYVKFGEAEKIAQTMNGIAKDAGPKPATGGGVSPIGGGMNAAPAQQQEIFGGDVKITADKTTNALIITASKQDYEVVLNLLSKIDIQRDQVFVEGVIMEMSINEGDKWEVGAYQFNSDSKGNATSRSGFNGLTNIGDLLNPIGGQGAILGFGSGDNVTISNGTTQTTVKSITGFLNFLTTNTKSNILSTPKIMVLDNQEAELSVGEKVATQPAVSTGTNGVTTSSPTYEDASLTLKVKPFISPTSNSIRMEIDQKVKQVSKTQTVIKDASNFTNRAFKTNIVVNDNDTAVIGGLLQDDESTSTTKVPLLGDIPLIGWLFKSTNVNKTKKNLLVFITPKIVRNKTTEGSKRILGEQLDERLDYIKANSGRDPYGRRIEKMTPKTADASAALDATPTKIDASAVKQNAPTENPEKALEPSTDSNTEQKTE